MSSIFFVESPLNLVCAYEAINFFKMRKYMLIVRLSSSENNNRQMRNLIQTLGVEDKVKYIIINSYKRSIADYLKTALLVLRSILDFRSTRIFIGNLHSGFLSIIARCYSRERVILIDDGSRTILLQKLFNDNYFYNLFTIYKIRPIKGQMVYKNSLEATRKIIKSVKLCEDSILFIGSKISEINIVSEEYYFQLLVDIFQQYSAKNIIYIPHREEKQSKVEKIGSISNVSIEKINYPVEMIGMYKDKIPKKALSFYSTALLTMKKLYGIEVKSCYFNYESSIYKNDIDTIYSFYAKELEMKSYGCKEKK